MQTFVQKIPILINLTLDDWYFLRCIFLERVKLILVKKLHVKCIGEVGTTKESFKQIFTSGWRCFEDAVTFGTRYSFIFFYAKTKRQKQSQLCFPANSETAAANASYTEVSRAKSKPKTFCRLSLIPLRPVDSLRHWIRTLAPSDGRPHTPRGVSAHSHLHTLFGPLTRSEKSKLSLFCKPGTWNC